MAIDFGMIIVIMERDLEIIIGLAKTDSISSRRSGRLVNYPNTVL
jgi:hypothetical protein